MAKPGELIAEKYRLEQRVGGGAMGDVFRARERGGRIVAVKCIAEAHANDPRYRERFQREVETSMATEHPYILDVYDSGELPDGGLYLVMRYMPDGDLDRYIEAQGRLSPRVAAELLLHVAEALECLHRAKIFHRDVKPSNLLVQRDGKRLHVYLSDFGIVKKADETPLTGTESSGLGTPPFAAPEQLAGALVGPAADVYAAGQTLGYLLNGQPKDRGHATDGGPIDRKLKKIVKKATRPEPSARYQSAGQLAAALRKYLRLPPLDIESRTKPSWRQKVARIAVILMALVAAPLGFIVTRNYVLPDSSSAQVGAVEILRSKSWHRVRSGFGINASASRPIVSVRPTDAGVRVLTVGTEPIPARAALAGISAAVHDLPTFRAASIGSHEADVMSGRLKDGREFVIDAVPASRGYIVLSCLSGGHRSPRFFGTCQREVASIGAAKGNPSAASPSNGFVSALRADWSLGVSARRREAAALKVGSLSDRAEAASAISDSYRRGASKLLAEPKTLIDESLARQVSNSMTATAAAFADLASASRHHNRRAYDRARTLIHRRDLTAETLAVSLKRSGIEAIFRPA